MKIDTLVLSGGGPSGVAYFGIFQSLFENNIINENLDGIKEIITTSAGIFPSVCLLIKFKLELCREIVMNYDLFKLLDHEDLKIDDFLVDFGFFSTEGCGSFIKKIIKNKLKVEDITLKELYEYNNVKLIVKVFNATKKQLEYISHETDPDLSVSKLVQMTTAIPGFFKPVKYNDCLYVDGGLRGHFPIEVCESKNYLGLFIRGGTVSKIEILEIFPILEFIYSLMINQDQTVYDIQNNKIDKRIIYAEIGYGLKFDMNKTDKEKIMNKGYEITQNHINQHLEINKV